MLVSKRLIRQYYTLWHITLEKIKRYITSRIQNDMYVFAEDTYRIK